MSLTHLALAAVQDVRCVNCDEGGTSFLELLGAISGLIGGAAAVLALALARTSATHAERSAAAADETAKAAKRTAVAAEEELMLMREEVAAARAERSRRADIQVEVTGAVTAANAGRPVMVQLTVGLDNTGSRTADRVTLNVLFPAGTALEPCPVPSWVSHSQYASTAEDDLGRGPEPCVYWSGIIGPVDPGNSYVLDNFLLRNPDSGPMPVLVKVMHNDLASDALWRCWVHVPAAGSDVAVEQVGPLS